MPTNANLASCQVSTSAIWYWIVLYDLSFYLFIYLFSDKIIISVIPGVYTNKCS